MVSICNAGLLLAPLSVTQVSLHFHSLGDDDDDGDVNENGKKAIRENKSHVYGKPLTSDSSCEFLKIEYKQIKTVQNNSYG